MTEKPSLLQSFLRPYGLLTVALGIVCLSTVMGFLGRFSWFLDLFSHFRVQYAVSLTLIGIVLLLMKRCKTAIIAILFACINFSIIIPLYFGGRTIPEDLNQSLRAMLLNVNTRFGDAEGVKHLINEVDPDILVLEEIDAQWMRDLQQLEISHPYSSVKARNDNFGIGLFSKLPIAEEDIAYIGDAQVPSIFAVIDIGYGRLHVVATHPPPPASATYSQCRNDQLQELAKHIPQSSPVILLGDLNTTPWNHYFKEFLKHSRLIDSSQGRGVQATWPSKSPLLLIPLDHFLHSTDIFVIDKKIGGSAGSDHYSMIIDFSIEKNSIKKP